MPTQISPALLGCWCLWRRRGRWTASSARSYWLIGHSIKLFGKDGWAYLPNGVIPPDDNSSREIDHLLTDMRAKPQRVVRFYNERGTAEG